MRLDQAPRAPLARFMPMTIVFTRGITLRALWALLIPSLFFIFVLSQQVSFVDLGYHLRAGEWAAEHGRWLDHDLFSHTAYGQPWLNQNWGAQRVFYALHSFAGLELLALVNAVLYGAGFVLLFRICLRRTGEVRIAALACVIGVLPSIGNTAVRPQALSWLFMAILLFMFERSASSRSLVWVAPVLFLLWANMHGAFVVGLAFFAVEVVAAIGHRHGRRDDRSRHLVAAFALSALAVLANPWGWRIYSYAWSIGSNPIVRRSVEEWQPPSVLSVPGVLFFVSVFVVVAIIALSSVRLAVVDLLRTALALALGLTAIRNGLWWSFAAAPALATLLSPLTAKFGPAAAAERPSRINAVIAASLVALVVLVSPWARPVSPVIPAKDRSLISNGTPIAAARFLATHELPGNMFNAQIYGSYLEWAAPDKATFIDSRIELFSPALWSDYGDVMLAKHGWQQTLERYDVGHVVLETSPRADLADALEDAGWAQVYRDTDATIYARPPVSTPLG